MPGLCPVGPKAWSIRPSVSLVLDCLHLFGQPQIGMVNAGAGTPSHRSGGLVASTARYRLNVEVYAACSSIPLPERIQGTHLVLDYGLAWWIPSGCPSSSCLQLWVLSLLGYAPMALRQILFGFILLDAG